MNRGTIIAFAALGLAGCADEYGSDLEVADWEQLAIYGGASPNAAHHDATVAITTPFLPALNIFCSGTLIAQDVVMTAAHCMDEAGLFAANYNELEPSEVKVGFGDGLASTIRFARVTDIEINPAYDRWALTDDIALIRLIGSIPTNLYTAVPNLPASDGLTSSDVGEIINHAGFGDNDVAGVAYGNKLQADGTIDAVYATDFEYSQNAGGPCAGDSGGPQFIDRSGTWYAAGVTSWGSSSCTGGGAFGYSTKVDAYESWIASF